MGGQDAGVDPGAAADVEQMAMPPQVDGGGKRLREVQAAAVHRRGERGGELLGLHRPVPVLAGVCVAQFAGLPVRSTSSRSRAIGSIRRATGNTARGTTASPW